MANKDLAVPIVFPDYLIMVETPAVNVNVPDVLPWVDILPDRIKVPPSKQKVPFLGHAGILFIEGKSGLTKYYEYGRYDPAAKGLVRKQSIADVKMGNNGRPTKTSLRKVLAEVSLKSGQSGKIAGAYIELDTGAFIKMLAHATTRMKQNTNPKRAPYELLSNSCLHFMKGVAEAGGASMPAVIAPQPAGYIVQVRLQQNDLDFDNSGSFTVDDVELQ
ncbi:MAG: hypothetical protein PHE55_08975 [Methylococcaceae bacterium]|nr:hypothetical protein [Methylococcaceae bacterium]